MNVVNRKELVKLLNELVCGKVKALRPILLLGDNDNERIKIFEKIDGCSSSGIRSARMPDASMYECHEFVDDVDVEIVHWGVNMFKETGKPVIYSVFFNDVTKLSQEVLDIFDVIVYENTKTDWVEWAKEIDPETGEANIDPIITDFVENSDEKYFIGTTQGRNARTGKFGWIYLNTACKTYDSIYRDLYVNTFSKEEYVASNIPDIFNEEFAQAFCDYYKLGDLEQVKKTYYALEW